MLSFNGYPFKSKDHSNKLMIYQHSGEKTKTIKRYLDLENSFGCPKKLKYQFTKDFSLKVSDRCCYKMKKEPAEKWSYENKKSITLTGMRSDEGGQRANKTCSVFNEDGSLKRFHPLFVCDDQFINDFIKQFNIKLCELYYPPFNFERTGCKGCPYSLDLQDQLDIMQILLPAEKKQCEVIWKTVYQEYRRIGYRLRSSSQPEFDF